MTWTRECELVESGSNLLRQLSLIRTHSVAKARNIWYIATFVHKLTQHTNPIKRKFAYVRYDLFVFVFVFSASIFNKLLEGTKDFQLIRPCLSVLPSFFWKLDVYTLIYLLGLGSTACSTFKNTGDAKENQKKLWSDIVWRKYFSELCIYSVRKWFQTSPRKAVLN